MKLYLLDNAAPKTNALKKHFSDIRSWLNNDFIHEAFTEEETSKILKVNEDKVSL